MSKHSVTVTEEVIAKSVQRDSSHCMIADAVRESIPDVIRVSVDLQTIRFTNRKTHKRYVYLTPRRAQVELIRFDQGLEPEPFSMVLQRPQIIEIPRRSPNRDSKEQREAKAAEEIVSDEAALAVADEEESTSIEEGAVETVEAEKPKAGRPKGSKARNAAQIKDANPNARPYRTGGRTPPTAVLSDTKGRIREFGLKQLNL